MSDLEELRRLLNESSGKRESMVRDIGNHTTALFGVFEEGDAEPLKLAGTGTFVSVEGSRFILTAAHVWDEVLRHAPRLGVTVKENLDHRFLIETRAILPFGPDSPDSWNEWGPDLIYLRVPSDYTGAIEAHGCCFYDLTRPRRAMPGCDALETWVLMGAPWASARLTPRHADLNIVGHFAQIGERQLKNGFDYIDLTAETELPGVPQEFGGVSGGGLWRVLIWMSASAHKAEWLRFLEGVAFYQLGLADGRRTIRCHGPESIHAALPKA